MIGRRRAGTVASFLAATKASVLYETAMRIHSSFSINSLPRKTRLFTRAIHWTIESLKTSSFQSVQVWFQRCFAFQKQKGMKKRSDIWTYQAHLQRPVLSSVAFPLPWARW